MQPMTVTRFRSRVITAVVGATALGTVCQFVGGVSAVAAPVASSAAPESVIVVLHDQLTATPADRSHVSSRRAQATNAQNAVLSRLSKRSANEAFETARQAAGLPEELDLHSLRHFMITHLVEFDYPERFVQDQAGHKVAATTAIYTGVSDEYRNRLLKSKLTARHADLWEKQP